MPKEIGELVFTVYEWGPDESGELYLKNVDLPQHICSAEELGLSDDNESIPRQDQFFKLHEKSTHVVKLYQKKFLCIDVQESYLFGDY